MCTRQCVRACVHSRVCIHLHVHAWDMHVDARMPSPQSVVRGNIVMVYTVMATLSKGERKRPAHVVMADMIMAAFLYSYNGLFAYIFMAYIIMTTFLHSYGGLFAAIVMAYAVTACIVTAYIVTAGRVMAHPLEVWCEGEREEPATAVRVDQQPRMPPPACVRARVRARPINECRRRYERLRTAHKHACMCADMHAYGSCAPAMLCVCTRVRICLCLPAEKGRGLTIRDCIGHNFMKAMNLKAITL